MIRFILLISLILLIGCSSSTSSTVSVTNQTTKPWTPPININQAQERFYYEQNLRNQKLLNDRYREDQRRIFEQQQRNYQQN